MEHVIALRPRMEKLIKDLDDDIRVGGMHAGMTHAVEVLLSRAVPRTPVRRSNLVNSETTEVSPSGDRGRVFTDDNAPYAQFVHDGTGLYGPEKRRIVPKNKKALYWSGAAHPVRSTAGMKGTPFFQMALDESDPGALFEEGMGNYLKARGW